MTSDTSLVLAAWAFLFIVLTTLEYLNRTNKPR